MRIVNCLPLATTAENHTPNATLGCARIRAQSLGAAAFFSPTFENRGLPQFDHNGWKPVPGEAFWEVWS